MITGVLREGEIEVRTQCDFKCMAHRFKPLEHACRDSEVTEFAAEEV
jgi:hypothetical protein